MSTYDYDELLVNVTVNNGTVTIAGRQLPATVAGATFTISGQLAEEVLAVIAKANAA